MFTIGNWLNKNISKQNIGPRIDKDAAEVPGGKGYKYFGRAKDLPGVQELFEKARATAGAEDESKFRNERLRDMDADYFGYRDEDDGILLPEEEKATNASKYISYENENF